MILESPDKVEDKGSDDFNYYKTIKGISYKIFCIKEKDKFIIKSAIKE